MTCTDACWAMPECAVCGKRKAPRGRSVPLPMAGGLCDWECPGYQLAPKPGHLWPGEDLDVTEGGEAGIGSESGPNENGTEVVPRKEQL